jgi:tetratricopeptide (TPR) repeat protein
VAGAGYAFWPSSGKSDTKSDAPDSSRQAAKQPTAAEKANAKGDYHAAAAALEQAPKEDTAARLELALAYSNAGEHRKALAVYDELEKAGKLTAGYTYQAGESARLTGDKPKAARYYKLAIKRYEEFGGPRAAKNVERCRQQLKEVEQS